MDKYRKVQDSTSGDIFTDESSSPTTLRISAGGRIRNYISAATKILDSDEGKEKGVTIVGMRKAIGKAITVAEFVKRSVSVVLYQNSELLSVVMKDKWEPIEEGLDALETSRTVSCVKIILTPNATQLNGSESGYQSSKEIVNVVTDVEVLNAAIAAVDSAESRDGGRSRGGQRRGKKGAKKEKETGGEEKTDAKEEIEKSKSGEGKKTKKSGRNHRRNRDNRAKKDARESADAGAGDSAVVGSPAEHAAEE
mmetsp:Transcript_4606/g.8042  ORF Transcript_4606/g.8042 Transcript_4606/m.8042 type:complete len:252 (-) Transcript_4606:1412-2167(-)